MHELSPPIVLFILLLAVSFLIPYRLARRRAKEYKHGKRKFTALSNNLLQLREHVTTEADRWPIYARPVLFTDDDHNAQLEFAKAQKALIDAEQILPEIETIDEPETSDQFRLNDIINVPRNLRTISLGSRLLVYVGELEEEILNVRSSLKSLRTNRQQVEKKRLAVESSIRLLRKRMEQLGRRLKPLDVRRSIEAHNLSWLVSIAERCQLEAQNSILTTSNNEWGYMEHARADVFVVIGNISLDCIELFLESQTISRRYELDKFKRLLNESTSFLQSILEMDEVWSSWKRLKKVRPYIEALPITRQEAQKSLRSFKNRQKHLESLIKLASDINVEDDIKVIMDLEQECTYYWYSYAERRTYWEKSLGNPVKFPSTEFNGFQALLVTQIKPEIDIDMVIKQSHMLNLIRRIGRALEWHNSIKLLTQQLESEIKTHKKAQKIVNTMLANDGEATHNLKKMEITLVDTSPDIADWGKVLVADYQEYSRRAEEVRGADFPELLNSLDQFIADSERLVLEHNSLLRSLEASYDDLYDHIESLSHELEIFISHIPRFEKDSVGILNNVFQETFIILGQQKNYNYTWLREEVNKMQAWSEKTDLHVEPARIKYATFENGRVQVEELLEQVKDAIDFNWNSVEQAWSWSKNEILPKTRAIARAFDLKKRDWERIIERNWIDYNISRAILECQSLIQFCESKLSELDRVIEKVSQKQAQLVSKANEIERLLQKNGYRITEEDQKQIIYLIGIAQQASTHDYADKSLNHAYSLALRQATAQVRNEIRKIIIDSGGGPIFLDAVNNNGKITGALRIAKSVKQRKRKNNEKKS